MRWVWWVLVGAVGTGCAVPAAEGEWVVGDLASSLEVGIAPGEVRLALHVTNTTASPMEFTFPTSQRYDFEVEDDAGARVWRWSDERSFLQVVTEARLEAGETWTMEAVWPSGQRAGAYVAVGRLVAEERPVEHRAEFEIP